MNIDMSKYKKIAEDKKSVTFSHPDKHQMIIAKHVLSPSMRRDFEKLPLHRAEGGDVPDPSTDHSDQNASVDPSIAPQPTSPATVINIGTPQPQPMATMPAAGTPVTPESLGIHQESQAPQFPEAAPARAAAMPPAQPPQAPQADPYGAIASSNIVKEGLGNVTQGLMGQAQGEAASNQAQAATLGKEINPLQQQQDDFNQKVNQLYAENQKMFNDVQTNVIKSNHYMQSMGTGQKIATGIGILLSGAGAGLMHSSNWALDYLNKQIDNDIQAQKANMGARQNLMGANTAMLGNLNQAQQMTAANQKTILQNKILETAMKTGNPQVIARAQQAVGTLELDKMNLIRQVAAGQTLQQQSNAAAQPGGGTTLPNTQMDPASKIKLAGMNGYISAAQQAQAEKELALAENMEKQRQNLLNAFDQVQKTNTLENRLTSPIQTPRQVKAYEEPLLGSLTKETEGRVTPTDIATIRPLFHSVGSDAQTDAISRQQLDNTIRQRMSFPALDSLGIRIGPGNLNQTTKVREGKPVLK